MESTVYKQGEAPYANLTQKFPSSDYNLLYPSETILQISPIQKITYEIIHISTNTDDGEVFSVGSSKEEGKDGEKDRWVKKLALAKPALEKISHAAGIIFDPHLTGKMPNANPRTFEYRVRGALQKPDGSWIDSTKSVTIEMDVVEEKLRFEIEEKAKDGKLGSWKKEGGKSSFVSLKYGTPECTREIEKQFMTQLITAKTFVGRKAETGAYNRVVRSLLGLKPSYTETDLKKPFVVVRATLDIEKLLNDVTTKQMLISASLNAGSQIFGHIPSTQPEVRLQLPAPVVSATLSDEPQNISDEVASETLEAEEVKHATTTPFEQKLDVIDKAKYEQEWKVKSTDERVAEINRLIKEKHFTPKTAKPTGELTAVQQIEYLWFLRSLANPQDSSLPYPSNN
jgi:hypothetical protein